MEALRKEVSGMLHPGEELVVAGSIALGITEELLCEKKEELSAHFSPSFLRDARMRGEKSKDGETGKNGMLWNLAEEFGVSARIEIGEDGFLAALWKIAEASEVGLHADLRKVPIYQETIEICECFDENPYEASSGYAFLAGFSHAYPFLEECRKREIPAAVIGMTNGENARLLYSGESCRYLDRPRKK